VPLVEEVLVVLGVPRLIMDDYEADDIIATLAKQCKEEGRQCYILSSDKDLLQLVDSGTWELRSAKASGRAGDGGVSGGLPYELVGKDEVKAEWGVGPDKVLDLLSLTGDSSDNVPGVKGVGEKTAVKLMSHYGSLDGIYKNIAGIEGAVGKKLSEGKESAYFSRYLESFPCVRFTAYPGLESHRGHAVAVSQMSSGFGGVLAFGLDADHDTHNRFVSHLRLITSAVSLGHDESFIVFLGEKDERQYLYPPGFHRGFFVSVWAYNVLPILTSI
jgi:5'-3' exonuclease